LEGKVKQQLEDCIEDIVDKVLPGSKKIADAFKLTAYHHAAANKKPPQAQLEILKLLK
jgi:hypothetical protein